MDSKIEAYQNTLIQKSLPLSEHVVEAFYTYPRHLFVPEYTVSEAYEDNPLEIFNRGSSLSTISQPSFALRILDMLDVHEGQAVFELGSGSGWNTSLLSYLVGPAGKVVSTEIIPQVAERAQSILDHFAIHNVRLIARDGFEGSGHEEKFDRIIFTAGSKEFPQVLFESLKENGLMIFIRQYEGSTDVLELIRKTDGHPEVKMSVPCSFVSVQRQNNDPTEQKSHQHDGIL